ncbi:MAG: hypothetical protein AABW65_02425 [Nanoarchaeota archaeon]
MKRYILLIALFLFLIKFAVAAELMIEKIDKGSVVISELDNPAIYELIITNNGSVDNYEIYTLVGISMTPKSTFDIVTGKNTVEVRAYPNKDLRSRIGSHSFEYQLKGRESGIFKDFLEITVVSLKDTISFKVEDIHINDSNAKITVKNIQNTNLENLNLHLSSSLFETDKKFSLDPYEEIVFFTKINKNKLKGLVAGPYVVKGEIRIENAKAEVEGTVKYLEKENIRVEKKTSGFILREDTTTKTNEGNVPLTARIEITKDIISRLFIVHSIEPNYAKREGFIVTYSWNKELSPGESFTVNSTTNYTFPFILVFLVIIISFFVKIYSQTSLVINKRVFFVKTKGGEFALKVQLRLKAKKYIENVQVIDRLPMMTQLYEKFGVKPDKIDHATKRLFWNISRLNAGEERIYSYIIYSKVRAIGRFELPSAVGIFERDGKTTEIFSNKAYFVSETTSVEY